MAYSFVEIEEKKSMSIGWAFSALVSFYFLSALCLVVLLKFFLIRSPFNPYSTFILWDFLNWPTAGWTFLFSGILGGIHWQVSTASLIHRTLALMGGQIVNESDQAQKMFANIVEEVSVATGGKHAIEARVIPVSAMNAFALQDFEGRCVIGVTHGLLARLNRAQLEAVVAHEAGHIASGDCLSTTVTMVLFRVFDNVCDVTWVMLHAVGGRRNRDNRAALVLVLVFILTKLLRFIGFLGALFISREREYRADALSVKLTRNPLALAEALSIIDNRWKGAGMSGQGMDAIFILNPVRSALDEQEDFFSSLFSTHPPIRKRIGILLDMAHVSERALDAELRKSFVKNPEAPVVLQQKEACQQQPDSLIASAQRKDYCPRCVFPLTAGGYEMPSASLCQSCYGVLVKEADVLQVLGRKKRIFSEKIQQMSAIIMSQQAALSNTSFNMGYDQRSILCPSCFDSSARMTRRFINPRYRVEIDRCRACSRIWFDKDELDLLECLYQEDHASAL